MSRYDLTPEHRARMADWAAWWTAHALRTDSMTEDDRDAMRVAIAGLYAAAGLPPPTAIVFAPGPVSAARAAGYAAGIWWLRERPERHVELFGRALGEDDYVAAVAALCRHCAMGAEVRAATWAAMEDAISDAIDDALGAATARPTEGRSDEITSSIMRDSTAAEVWAATWEPTAAETWDATSGAAEIATRDATASATWRESNDRVYHFSWREVQIATRDATDHETADATWRATLGAPSPTATGDLGPLATFLSACAAQSYRMRSGGSEWAGHAAFISFFRYVVQLPIDYAGWEHYEQAALHGASRWMHSRFVIVADRPEYIRMDDEHRLHCTDGPARRDRDGYKHWYVHGMRAQKEGST